MNELQTSRLPSNFYVYEKNDYHSLDCQQEKKAMCRTILKEIKNGLFHYPY